jgi:hypothetical protein
MKREEGMDGPGMGVHIQQRARTSSKAMGERVEVQWTMCDADNDDDDDDEADDADGDHDDHDAKF